MNKMLFRGILVAAALALSGCVTNSGTKGSHLAQCGGSAKDPFRINMKAGYGPNTPAVPKPAAGAKHWNDVANWQCFLKDHWLVLLDFDLLSSKYPNGKFDEVTDKATRKFQGSIFFGNTVKRNGIVSWATYYRAIRAGMPRYEPVKPSLLPRKRYSANEVQPATPAGFALSQN